MSQIQLAFVANDGNAYAPETEIGQQLSYITWTPSKMRIERMENSDFSISYTVHLSQNSTVIDKNDLPEDIQKKYNGKIVAPKVLFYKNDNGKPAKESSETIKVTIPTGEKHVDFYIGGKFQEGMLYGGASPEDKDINITANGEETSFSIMIRVRRNANELTTKAKEDYLNALSEINKRDEEGVGLGVYSTDFFQMHIKGSKSIAHGSSVFLPWHRLYLLDLERTLQERNPTVSLHYWKFDEPAPNIFKDDFLGETISDKSTTPLMHEGFGDNFAKFSDSNPLKNWSIGREKLIRRKTWFDNQAEQSGYNKGGENPFYLKDEFYVYHKNNDKLREVLLTDNELPYSKVFAQNSGKDPNNLDSFTGMELNPHGEAHTSINGFLNYVPTAPKDPLFFFLHCNVDRMWAQWQRMIENGFDYQNEKAYKEMTSLSWTKVDEELWPWKRSSTPNNYHMIPPGTRAENFSKSFSGKVFLTNIPKIADAIDAFGIFKNENNLGFSYDTLYNDVKRKSNKILSNHDNTGEYIFGNQSHIAIPNIVHFSNNRLLSKIVSDNPDLIDNSERIKDYNISNSIHDNRWTEILKRIKSKLEANVEFFVDLDNYSKHLRDVDYLEAAHNYDINLLGEVEHQFDRLFLKASSSSKISKHIIVYIMSIINNEKIQDDNIVEFIKNNIGYFSDITNEEVLDVKITLYSFASYSTIKNGIIPKFFANKEAMDLVLENRKLIDALRKKLNDEKITKQEAEAIREEIFNIKVELNWEDVDQVRLNEYLDFLKSKSEGKNSKSNKYWALHTLLTNAGLSQ